ncbi:ion channel [Paraflavisolibacter sp. H34]|uniref:ion channel n=1 Tax=Huijunlia imazamoxiresistens TaxID=3127457 RepID=UPI00301708D6
MSSLKVNPISKSNPDTGLGVKPAQVGGRFINKDGTFNLHKRGWPFFTRVSPYPYLLDLSWTRFLGLMLLFYFLVNLLFTSLYLAIGPDQLQGLQSTTFWGRAREIFFFSTETFTTVGYGRINPVKGGADLLASLEAFLGWLFFALVTGLLYGRFVRPKAFIAFSHNALVSPYLEGKALMFRMVPYKSRHFLTDVRTVVNLSLLVGEGEQQEYKYYTLKLERSRIEMFNMNWTVVHPIDVESPLLDYTLEDMLQADMEVMVQVSGFDPVFSSTVMKGTSYTAQEIIMDARFAPMYHESADDSTTILELNKLNEYQKT